MKALSHVEQVAMVVHSRLEDALGHLENAKGDIDELPRRYWRARVDALKECLELLEGKQGPPRILPLVGK